MQGKTFGEWTIIELIDDSSGNGTVWRVSKQSGEQGAIKILKQFDSVAQAAKRRTRFINEIKKLELIMQMGITGVMPICDYNADGEQPWFVMPLAHRLQPREDRTNWAVETMITIAQTIANLHAEGMVHRDIKPNNILVLDDKVVVSDFGLAQTADDDILTNTGEGVGSQGYIAPECVGHSDEPQFKGDVYALAKTAWVLLTGAKRPPHGELGHNTDTLAALGITSNTLKIDEIEDLLSVSTSRDPNDRPTAKQFVDGLIACSRTENNPPVRKSGSPAIRAKKMFADQAAKNRRDKESQELFQSFQKDASNKFKKVWGEVVQNLGWPNVGSSGGNPGKHVRQLDKKSWDNHRRYFFKGEMNSIAYEVALTIRRKKTMGEARMVCGATIAIQTESNEEYILSTSEFETFTHGPQVERTRQSLLAFVEIEETQHRMLEKFKELSKKNFL